MAERDYTPIQIRQPPPAVTHLNYRVVLVALGSLLALSAALMVGLGDWGRSPAAPEEAPAPIVVPGGDFLQGAPKTYRELPQPVEPPKFPRAIPMAPMLPQPVMTASLAPVTPAPAPPHPTPATFPVVALPPPGHTAPAAATTPPGAATPQGQKPQPPERKPRVLMPTALNTPGEKGRAPGAGDEAAKAKEQGQLIKPAAWERPVKPWVTLYRSMLLKGVTLDEINSDINGQVRIRLTEAVMDKFDLGHEILAKDSLVIVTQTSRPGFGTTRIESKLEQIELPSGEVLALKAAVADDKGAAGLTGRIDAHIPKILLATAISAVLNFGVRSAAGQPGRGEHYQDPAQVAAQDLGQSVQRDASSYVDKVLRQSPTIVVKAGTPCTIALGENVQLNRPPRVAQ